MLDSESQATTVIDVPVLSSILDAAARGVGNGCATINPIGASATLLILDDAIGPGALGLNSPALAIEPLL